MTCADCPFSLTCLRGRLGHPYEMRLCPKCGCLSFTMDQEVLINPAALRYPSQQVFATQPTDPPMDETLVPVSKKNAHIFIFECEKRPVSKTLRVRWLQMCVREKDTKGVLAITLDDPAGFQPFPLVHLRPCVACAGQFDRASFYWKVHFHQLDDGDEMPTL